MCLVYFLCNQPESTLAFRGVLEYLIPCDGERVVVGSGTRTYAHAPSAVVPQRASEEASDTGGAAAASNDRFAKSDRADFETVTQRRLRFKRLSTLR